MQELGHGEPNAPMSVNFSWGENEKQKDNWCWAGFGIGTFGGGPKGHIPLFGLYTSHILRNHRTAQNLRTPQMSSHCTAGEYTYSEIIALHEIIVY